MQIRAEQAADHEAVYAVHAAAFATPAEAELVERLRQRASPIISLVAESAGEVVGHILFTPVQLDGASELQLMGLAPMAVLPGHQRQGIGSQLISAGLEQCEEDGFGAVVVLGHANYYPKFGFRPSTEFGINSDYDVAAEVFMVRELRDDYLQDHAGTVHFHEEFNKL